MVELSPSHMRKKWQLLYKGSRDGFGAEDFHEKCDGIPNTFTLIQSTRGHIFGGFSSKAWQSNGKFKSDNKAYIFSLVNNENEPFRRQYHVCERPSINCSSWLGPGFGRDICIASNSNVNEESFADFGHSYRHIGFTYGSEEAKSILAGVFHFKTLEIAFFSRI